MIRVRFAPAPTGPLFIGGVRVALANYLFALRGNGQMLLRLDDLDQGRDRPVPAADMTTDAVPAAPKPAGPWADQVMQDLRWFGIDWCTSFRQSERRELYQHTIERLKRDKFLYPCFESEEELKAKQEFRRKRNQSPIYDRAMLSLTEKQRHDAEAGGKRPHWRLKLSGRTMEWQDLVLGPRRATLSAVSDPVLVRADGSPTRTGLAIQRAAPNAGCSTSVTSPRAAVWGSASAERTSLIGPQGTPAAVNTGIQSAVVRVTSTSCSVVVTRSRFVRRAAKPRKRGSSRTCATPSTSTSRCQNFSFAHTITIQPSAVRKF